MAVPASRATSVIMSCVCLTTISEPAHSANVPSTRGSAHEGALVAARARRAVKAKARPANNALASRAASCAGSSSHSSQARPLATHAYSGGFSTKGCPALVGTIRSPVSSMCWMMPNV
jgi:hypothetical protein